MLTLLPDGWEEVALFPRLYDAKEAFRLLIIVGVSSSSSSCFPTESYGKYRGKQALLGQHAVVIKKRRHKKKKKEKLFNKKPIII